MSQRQIYLMVKQSGFNTRGVEPVELTGTISATIWQGEAGRFLAANGADPDSPEYRDDLYIAVLPEEEAIGREDGTVAGMTMQVTAEEAASLVDAMAEC